jgi:hypothetical protein
MSFIGSSSPKAPPPEQEQSLTPQLRAHTFSLSPGAPAVMFATFGDFVYIDTAAVGFQLSFDNLNFIPVREGRLIQTKGVFSAFYLRAPADGALAEGIAITGEGSVTSFATFGGGGVPGSGPPGVSVPFASYAELGNAATTALKTGVYAIVITGAPPSAETWQLRAWVDGAAPVTDAAAGLIVPFDYSATNARVWRRA